MPGATSPATEELEFLGLVGLIDPPRPEVKAAIAGAHSAGIRVIMITGDSPVTARAIAEALRDDMLFSRVAPAHQMRIVQALQATGQIAAMTGDDVNDAPALEQANVGVAIGIRGTDVAKDAADLVLLDESCATIVRAIAEGPR